MGILGGLFNDVVDIVAAPVKIVTKITDEVMETDLTRAVNEIKKCVKADKDN